MEIAEKLSFLLDLDLLLDVKTLRRFVQLKPLQVKCFEYLLNRKARYYPWLCKSLLFQRQGGQ